MKKILLSAALVLTTLVVANQTASAQSKAEADKWFAAQQYLGGLKIVPAPSTNTVEFAKQYKLNKTVWDKVFAYLKRTNLDSLPIGKYPLDGDNAFVSVTDNPTKPYDKTTWESHRKYIDFQYVAQGAEGMAAAPAASLKLTDPYNEAKDVAHYEGTDVQYDARPGTFYLFFPADAHRVNIKVDGAEHDKKIVIKIKYVE
jgi:biofilm protein TabA